MRDRFGVDAIQFYDHNFFDREVDMVPLLEVLAKFQMPWWCFARSDALVNLSETSWALVRKSRSAHGLHRRGVAERLAAARYPQGHAVRSDLGGRREMPQPRRDSGALVHGGAAAGPGGRDGEDLRVHPHDQAGAPAHGSDDLHLHAAAAAHGTRRRRLARMASEFRDCDGQAGRVPANRRWMGGAADGSIIGVIRMRRGSRRGLRRRIVDFTTVLGCRFPTIMDIRASAWGKSALRALASWRYRFQRYDDPWELRVSRKLIRQWDPRVMSL